MIENLDLKRIRVLDKLVQSKNETVADLLEQALVVANMTAEYELETSQEPRNKGPLERMYDSLKSLENRISSSQYAWAEPTSIDITMAGQTSLDNTTWSLSSISNGTDIIDTSTIYIDLSGTNNNK